MPTLHLSIIPMSLWLWAILLLILGTGFALMEVFFPSAGILGFLSAVSLLAAVVMGFYHSTFAGLLILLGAAIGLPTTVILGFKYWPKTAMGRRILLMGPSSEDVLPASSERDYLKSLIGHTGRAKSKMLLSGVIVVDGRTIDAVSESMPIEIGQAVRVVQVRGHGVVVRPVDESAAPAPPTDPLKQVYDDPFDLPPA
jgi:membrane-bound ClpP family serine protease